MQMMIQVTILRSYATNEQEQVDSLKRVLKQELLDGVIIIIVIIWLVLVKQKKTQSISLTNNVMFRQSMYLN